MTKNQIIKLLAIKKRLERFVQDPKELNLSHILSHLKQFRLAELNEFCVQDATLRKLLALPYFDTFWKTQREAIRVKDLPLFRFKKSSRLSDMNFTLGYLNYYLSLKFPEKREHFLQQALSFHSYHALDAYAHECFMQMFAKQEEEVFFNSFQLLPVFEKEAAWSGTPACLILANLYLRAAFYFAQNDKAYDASAAFQSVVRYLQIAARLEPESIDEIHNAYFSRGLAHNNPFHLLTIQEMQHACIKTAGNYLSQSMINQAINSAKAILLLPDVETPYTIEPLSPVQRAILNDSPELVQIASSSEHAEQLTGSHLLFAVRHEKISCIRYLLTQALNSQMVDDDKNNCLHLAAINKNYGIYRLLEATIPELKKVKNVFQLTPVDILNETKQNLSLDRLQSQLTQAVLTEDMDALEQCLQLGANPDVILPGSISPLASMMKTFNIKGIKLLMNAGASLCFADAKGTPSFFHLLDCSDVKRTNRHIYFRHLLNLGININHQNNEGETLLIQAVRRDDYESVLFLLEQRGINTKITDVYGLNAMDYAEKNPDSKIAQHFYFIGDNSQCSEKEAKLSFKEPRFFKAFETAPSNASGFNVEQFTL